MCANHAHQSIFEGSESINKLLKFVEVTGFTVNGLHRKIYLSDPRKTGPEKLTTLISYPFI